MPNTIPEQTLGLSTELPIKEQHAIIGKLLEKGTQVPNTCTVAKKPNGKYNIIIEAFVIELEEGVVNHNARVVPYRIELNDVEYTPISFYYNKPDKNPNGDDYLDFKWDKKTRESNERIVLPISRIMASSGTTLVRPNHIYYNGNGGRKLGVDEAIIALIIENGEVTNKNRYFPIDCAVELLRNIVNCDPMNIPTIATYRLNEIEATNTEDLVAKTASRVEHTKNPLS